MSKRATLGLGSSPEACYGCGEKADEHPWAAVLWLEDAWTKRPVCDACHRDPTRRKRPIKAHFFPAAIGSLGVRRAGSSNIGG